MPSTLGVSAVPAERPDVSLQVGAVPAFYLSESPRPSGGAQPAGQFAAVFEPDRRLGLRGLVLGARRVSGQKSGDAYFEPIVGVRRFLDDGRRVAVLLAASAGKAGHAVDGVSYSATRAGGDVSFDLRLVPENKWVELHLNAGASATALSASGTYCVDDGRRYPIDCPSQPTAPPPKVSAHASGIFPALVGGASLDVARHLPFWFHGARLAIHIAHGEMPTVVGGVEGDRRAYTAGGATVTLAFGDP